MALAVQTLRPISTSQMGLPTNTVVPSGTADSVLADSSDTTYVQLTAQAVLDSEVIRVGFPAPSLPTGAKVASVALRRRTQSVVVTDPVNQPPPITHCWLRCLIGEIEVLGQLQQPKRSNPVTRSCPTSTTTSAWIDEDLGAIAPPAGAVWDPATTLSNLTCDIGRDSAVDVLRVAALYVDVTYQQVSTVTATGPTGDSTDTRPTVTWLYASPDSKPQQSFRTAVYTADQVAAAGFVAFTTTPIQASNWTPGTSWSSTSGWVLGDDLQWTLTSDLTDGDYVAYIQAEAQWSGDGDFPTEVDSTSWTRAATPVSPPPDAVLDSVVFDTDFPAGRVAITCEPGGTTPDTTAYTIRGSQDDGVTYVSIPSLTYVAADPGGGPITVYDYNYYALNAPTKYQVIAYNGSILNAAVNPSNVLSVTPTGDQDLLKHPTDHLLNTVFPIAAPKPGEGLKATEQMIKGEFTPVGSPGTVVRKIVVSGSSSGYKYEVDALFVYGEESFDFFDSVVGLQRSGSVLLWQRPTGNIWVSIGSGDKDTEQKSDAVPGNPAQTSWIRRTLTLIEQDPPLTW